MKHRVLDGSCTVTRPIGRLLLATRKLVRPLNTSAFMGTNPENEAQLKVNECIALNGPSGRPFIESAHNLHELASHQNDRAPQYEGNAIE